MNCHLMRHAFMNNKNRSSYFGEHTVRITRARAKELGSSVGLPSLHPSAKQNAKVLHTNSKRAASDDKKPAVDLAACRGHKKRAVLRDVTNTTCQNVRKNCSNAGRGQHSKHDIKGSLGKGKVAAPACTAKTSQVPRDTGGNITEELKRVKVEEIGSANHLAVEPTKIISTKMLAAADLISKKTNFNNGKLHNKEENLDSMDIIDIDSKKKDPLMCSQYAADIYSILYVTQLARRPLIDYIEKRQKDITQGMRAILIDWLVEVSDEYGLVPDTLYLTVNLIDRFLAENYIEKQKLQLLGVTCMLIASKFEEICAPRVEDFCFITDNTYTKEEVVKMESHVLNVLGFQLFDPTTKKFLRRFIQAAQASYKVASVELEFLANYLAELTLMEYSFLKFLPSLIAASAVFLARWTLDQSDHPWNPTMEHYTRYKTSELKSTVFELQDLQLNTKGCMLHAIREKYKQTKFKCVATLCSTKPVQSLFQA